MKSLSTYILESKLTIFDEILENFEPVIAARIDAVKANYAENDRIFTKYDEQYERLLFTYDLISSMSKYILSTDRLVKCIWSGSITSKLIATVIIERNSVNHTIYTDIITAGGHNIQRMHYRYIVKTDLLKHTSTEAVKYENVLKVLSKSDKFRKDIDVYSTKISELENKISALSAYTENDILNSDKQSWQLIKNITWSDIIQSGADKNYSSEQAFNASKENIRLETIQRFGVILNGHKNQILIYKKQRTKIIDKLNALSNVSV